MLSICNDQGGAEDWFRTKRPVCLVSGVTTEEVAAALIRIAWRLQNCNYQPGCSVWWQKWASPALNSLCAATLPPHHPHPGVGSRSQIPRQPPQEKLRPPNCLGYSFKHAGHPAFLLRPPVKKQRGWGHRHCHFCLGAGSQALEADEPWFEFQWMQTWDKAHPLCKRGASPLPYWAVTESVRSGVCKAQSTQKAVSMPPSP